MQVSDSHPLWPRKRIFCSFLFLQGFCLFACVIVICGCWKGRKFLQLSYYISSRLSEDLNADSGSVAEFLCVPAHAIFISFSFSHLKKENKQDTCFSFCSTALHVYWWWFLPIALATAILHPFGVDITSNSGPFLWQWRPPCSSFVCYKGKNLHSHWRHDRKVMGLNCSRLISFNIRKHFLSIRRNEEGCSDPCSNPGHCFDREHNHYPEQCMDSQVGKSILVPVTVDQRQSTALEFWQVAPSSWNKARHQEYTQNPRHHWE